METVAQDDYPGTKVIEKACKYVDHRLAAAAAPSGRPKARALGRVDKSSDELVEAVEKYRKNGGA